MRIHFRRSLFKNGLFIFILFFVIITARNFLTVVNNDSDSGVNGFVDVNSLNQRHLKEHIAQTRERNNIAVEVTTGNQAKDTLITGQHFELIKSIIEEENDKSVDKQSQEIEKIKAYERTVSRSIDHILAEKRKNRLPVGINKQNPFLVNEQLDSKIAINISQLGKVSNLRQIVKKHIKTHVILYGTSWFRQEKAWWGEGKSPFQDCKYTNCLATRDKSMYQSAGAVIFHAHDLGRIESRIMRRYFDSRPSAQKWIYYTLESPIHAPVPPPNFYFNWTITYSRQSEVRTPYGTGYYENLEKTILQNRYPDYSVTNFAVNKTKLAIWIASNCVTQSNRIDYVNELKLHAKVDVVGRCSDDGIRIPYGVHMDAIVKEYKFYLAFENSLCTDYISEKPYDWALSRDLVPVVMGAKKNDYEERFPSGSFIHVDDFKSPKDLANYLNKVDKDDKMFNQYFDWKRNKFHKKHVFDTEAAMCQICKLLNNPSEKPEMVNVVSFWSEQNMCWSPRF